MRAVAIRFVLTAIGVLIVRPNATGVALLVGVGIVVSIADLVGAAYLHLHLVAGAAATLGVATSLSKSALASLAMAAVALTTWFVTGLAGPVEELHTARLAVTVLVGMIGYVAAHAAIRSSELATAAKILRGQL